MDADPIAVGATLFDDGRYWDAHEAWEGPWRAETREAERLLLQALIQVAAAFHKARVVGDAEAATRIFAKARGKLDAISGVLALLGVDVEALRTLIDECALEVARAGVGPRTIPRWSSTPAP